MSNRKFVNALIFFISILIVNLVTDKITSYLLDHKHIMHPAKATLTGMLIMVCVLYPAFMWIDDLTEKITKSYFKAGKNAAGKTIGVVLTFLMAFGVLFLLYLHQWFGLYIWNLF
jgi:multidrug efflux pump subunit AcrB